ncbi:MAG: DUF4007 family protein [Spirochaetales bacterium]
MRYGGHQTFPVREGWLHKALELLDREPKAFAQPDLADALGVGSNMAKAIEHWIVATGLARKRSTKDVHDSGVKYDLTNVGSVIWQHDPYLTLDETWWILHINLVNDASNATTWDWFFNEVSDYRFDKAHLVSRLLRRERQTVTKPSSESTIERDVTCFLNTYAVPVPREKKDPEEDLGSPFQELRLMSALKNSGTFELHRRSRGMTPEVLVYSLLRLFDSDDEHVDFSFSWLTKQRSGPLQTLALTTESLFEQIMELEQTAEEFGFAVRGLAGDRQLTFRRPSSERLLAHMYERLN